MTFALAFTLLTGLLLWFLVGSRGKWPAKLALIVLIPVFGWLAWHGYGTFGGYPVRSLPPRNSVFVAAAIDEPHWIYLWLVVPPDHGPFVFKPGVTEPRAYRVRYSRQLHEQLVAAQQAQAHGLAVGLRRGLHDHGRYIAYKLPAGLPPKR